MGRAEKERSNREELGTPLEVRKTEKLDVSQGEMADSVPEMTLPAETLGQNAAQTGEELASEEDLRIFNSAWQPQVATTEAKEAALVERVVETRAGNVSVLQDPSGVW